MKLQSMTDYVLDNANKLTIADIYNYANFLKLKLEKWMFIPCDSDGNVLEEPIETIGCVELYAEKYQQAKENVIFEGFYITKKDDKHIILKIWKMSIVFDIENDEVILCDIFADENYIETIEDLVKYDLTLTENAIKKYKL